MDYWKDVPGLDEKQESKLIKLSLFQADQKLGTAASELNMDNDKEFKIAQAIFKLKNDIHNIQAMIRKL